MAPHNPDKKLPRKVLLLTNVDAGEVTVHLSLGHALMHEDPSVEVHLATFGAIKSSLAATNEFALRTAPTAKPIVLHEIGGLAWSEAMWLHSPGKPSYLPDSLGLPPSFKNTQLFLRDLAVVMCPWDGPELVKVYNSIMQIITEVSPDIIAVNSMFAPGMTAANKSGIKWVILSPNTIKDFSTLVWKYPVIGSALPFPVPWYLVPLNLFLLCCLGFQFLFNTRANEIRQYVLSQTGAKVLTTAELGLTPIKGLKILIASNPGIEYPGIVVPEHVRACGPMPRPAPPVSEVDPELEQWLSKGPTVYINLGTHLQASEADAAEMALALRTLMQAAEADAAKSSIQVLWKLKKEGNYPVSEPGCKIHSIIGKEIENDRVRIIDWVKPEPNAVLLSGHVVCSVNHGGANSFLEAICAGVPQVVLPVWADCFDFAQRAEILGIGRWGSRTMRPRWSAEELAPELLDVVLKRRDEFKARAKKLAEENQGGGAQAARFVLAEIEGN